MNISKISKLVLAIFVLLSVKCICEEGSLTNKQIIALIRQEVKKIKIPDYEKPEDIELYIDDIETDGLEIKYIAEATPSNLKKALKKAGLSKKEISIMKGIIFASKSSFKSFNFEIKETYNFYFSDSYDLRFSQIVGFAQKQNDLIEVAFVNVVVTAVLSFPEYRMKQPVYKTNGKVAYDDYERIITTRNPPTADEMYSISTFLREHTKNELLEFTEEDS